MERETARMDQIRDDPALYEGRPALVWLRPRIVRDERGAHVEDEPELLRGDLGITTVGLRVGRFVVCDEDVAEVEMLG